MGYPWTITSRYPCMQVTFGIEAAGNANNNNVITGGVGNDTLYSGGQLVQ